MYRSLIVARMRPDAAADVADIFAASDRGDLPGLVGVTGRSLFHFGEDLYMHLVEADRPPAEAVAALTGHPEFRAVSDRLSTHISAYDPRTWRGPKDAMAREFYRWERPSDS
ncbi:TcmI family type II polyketide cyclase [Yinghuangia soli]|uniref:TcmI family type II polyketide cyclase n=1 Tax=Yinghuangia soli TaxID=2908204 RepID=A0AA41Q3W6_9ACTN|nr:TcmI family type II polyketide cyclase [Yinghuangia soli]MCF2531070.1 TcmI family type II polyketide cyclase [Yinghuangia soli]